MMKTVLSVEYAELVSAGLHVSTSVRISTTVFVTMPYSLPYRTEELSSEIVAHL